jgi:tripartite-type tricarboxylate transporter receptor subunit TctC
LAKTYDRLIDGRLVSDLISRNSDEHCSGLLLIKMNAVAYRASNQQMQDLVGGQIRIACDNFSSAWEQVQAGKIRALAITSAKRYSFAPDIPTFAETFKGFEVQAWFGWIAPTGVPKIIIDKLTAELNAVGQELEVRKRLDTFTVEFSGLSGQAFADFAARSARRSPLLLRRPTSS